MREILEAQREERAERRVQMFVSEFEPSYEKLAYHAALPLVLTPELVNYLRNEFLRREGVPWVAEADLLLSDLCSPVGYELYAMDADVRAYLLEQMAADEAFGPRRMQQVARLLVSYVRYLSEQGSQMSHAELEAQQWAAMLYLGPGERQQVAQEIAVKFQMSIAEPVGGELLSKAELGRLAQLTETFAPQLAEYKELVDYAALVSDVLLGRDGISIARVDRSYEIFPGLELTFPENFVKRDRLLPTEDATGETMRFSNPDRGSPQFTPLDVETAQLVDTAAFPTLQEEEFTVATLVPKPQSSTPESSGLEFFEFETATLMKNPSAWSWSRAWDWEIQRRQGRAERMVERLPGQVPLEMVLIPGGSFWMGSPEDEPARQNSEGPPHKVTVSPFLMGRYPVTQAQWKAIAELPSINQSLGSYPSRFKGKDRPVENVSWQDAIEFCQRLSQYSGCSYRLPSEAEWEYACREFTTTPFHFGETLSPALANYRGESVYGKGASGKYRQETTPVGIFPANAFGLSDMHGNVWEWCQDHYHDSYEGAPTDGSAWVDENPQEKLHIQRGGSWVNDPGYCRSARRDGYAPVNRYFSIGFRVVCAAPRA